MVTTRTLRETRSTTQRNDLLRIAETKLHRERGKRYMSEWKEDARGGRCGSHAEEPPGTEESGAEDGWGGAPPDPQGSATTPIRFGASAVPRRAAEPGPDFPPAETVSGGGEDWGGVVTWYPQYPTSDTVYPTNVHTFCAQENGNMRILKDTNLLE